MVGSEQVTVPEMVASPVFGTTDPRGSMVTVICTGGAPTSAWNMSEPPGPGPKLPTIGVGQKVELAVHMLETAPALLVLSGGRPLSVLTRTDVLSYFTATVEGGEVG